MDPVIRDRKRFQKNRTTESAGGVNDKAAEAPTYAPNKVCVGLLRMPQGFSALISGFSVMENKEMWLSFTCTLAPPSFRHGSGRNPGTHRTGFRLRSCRNDLTARWELGCGHRALEHRGNLSAVNIQVWMEGVMRYVNSMMLSVLFLIVTTVAWAQSLDDHGDPDSPDSAMYTLDDIYDRAHPGQHYGQGTGR